MLFFWTDFEFKVFDIVNTSKNYRPK
jgi:hypothetical protein